MKDTYTETQRHRQRENQAPCTEPDVGLDPGTLGSRLEPKVDAQPLSHPGISEIFFLKTYFFLRREHTCMHKQMEGGGRAGEGWRGRSRLPTEHRA